MADHTHAEILSQPEIWRTTLEDLAARSRDGLPRLADFDFLIFTGCGSTFYLSLWAARWCQRQHGRPAVAVPASDLLTYADAWLAGNGHGLVVAISRSGETTETLRAVQAVHQAVGGRVVGITCHPESRLTRASRWSITAPAAQERSVVQTRSFTSMMLAAAWLIAGEIPDGLPVALGAQAARLMKDHDRLAWTLASDLELTRYIFLGSGPEYGLACEAMLKLKETSLASTEAYHIPEIRHGPMSLVGPTVLVVGLLSRETTDAGLQVLNDMQRLGGRTLALGSLAPGRSGADNTVNLGNQLPALWAAPLYLPFIHLLSYYRALAHGLDPDQPRHLSQVVVLDE
jgi:glucosamine--fructose-6-phosphate aminotransferase (isomerizing)